MKTKFSEFKKSFYLGDIAILNLAFITGFCLKFFFNFVYIKTVLGKYFTLAIIFNVLWLILSYNNLQNTTKIINRTKLYSNALTLVLFHGTILGLLLFATKTSFYSRAMLFYTYMALTIFLVLFRYIYYKKFIKRRMLGLNTINIVVVGYNNISIEFNNLVENNLKYGYKNHGFFTDKKVDDLKVLGKLKDLNSYLKSNKIDEVFCALPFMKIKDIQEMMLVADNRLAKFRLITDLRGVFNREIQFEPLDQLTVLSFREERLDEVENKIAKRIFDIVFSFLVIFLIFPVVFPIIILLIKLESKGPVFFKQKRSGFKNKEFYCYKFRTMKENEDADTQQASLGDQRITRIGKFLRKSNIDELPQFLNVLKGEMSVVGPRPHMVFHTETYRKIIENYMVRHYVKPGITGLAQVKGFRGETKTTEDMQKRIEADIYYLENWSFQLDMKIIIMTVLNMFKGEKNAY